MELTNNDILCVLYAAKEKFIANRNIPNHAFGMCFYIENRLSALFNIHLDYDEIKNIIPEFIPETFKIDVKHNPFWWNKEDIDSRIKAFDKLIEIYKNK